MKAGVIILTRKISATMASTITSYRSSLEDVYDFLFSIPEPPGAIQTERGENEMPGIEEPQKQENVQHLDPHGDEGGEGMSAVRCQTWTAAVTQEMASIPRSTSINVLIRTCRRKFVTGESPPSSSSKNNLWNQKIVVDMNAGNRCRLLHH
jgi:hypothetical protein